MSNVLEISGGWGVRWAALGSNSEIFNVFLKPTSSTWLCRHRTNDLPRDNTACAYTVEFVRRIIYFAHACTFACFAKHSDCRLTVRHGVCVSRTNYYALFAVWGRGGAICAWRRSAIFNCAEWLYANGSRARTGRRTGANV